MSRLPFDEEPTSKVTRVTGVTKVPNVAASSKSNVRPPVPGRTILTVSELNATIRDLLENQLQNVWVEGEISNARVWNTGHMYFTLKDGASQIKAVMFKSAVRYLKFKPEDGIKVVARGKITVYDPLTRPKHAETRRAQSCARGGFGHGVDAHARPARR